MRDGGRVRVLGRVGASAYFDDYGFRFAGNGFAFPRADAAVYGDGYGQLEYERHVVGERHWRGKFDGGNDYGGRTLHGAIASAVSGIRHDRGDEPGGQFG
jgi:hypothetical protein